MKRSLWACGLAFLAGTAGTAEAAFATYTESVTASGILGATQFTNALVTLTQTADTTNVIFNNGFYSVAAVTSTVNVAGVGTASFTAPTFAGVQVAPAGQSSFGGLGQGTAGVGGPSIVSVINSAFDTFDLKSSLGPLSGTVVFNTGLVFNTNLGGFSLSSVSNPATYQATVQPAAVPEPSSLALVTVAALVGLGVRARRRRAVA